MLVIPSGLHAMTSEWSVTQVCQAALNWGSKDCAVFGMQHTTAIPKYFSWSHGPQAVWFSTKSQRYKGWVEDLC